ncbi:MAG: chloride channel protein, partial [Rhodospirillales bacterium]|nr:chloride channel protein [Rhodospirillales bacterium]
LSEAAFETSYDAHLKAVDVARANPPVLPISANLEEARRLLDDAQENQIAVVEDMESMTLVGFLRERDVMAAYNQAMEAARAEERGEVSSG